MARKILALLLLPLTLLAAASTSNPASGFGTCVALRPGKIVGIDCKKMAQLPPDGGEDFVAIGCGKDLFLALRYDGSLIAWGADRYGAVKDQPKGNNFVGIACGMDHCLAMRSDGTIIAWGGSERADFKPLNIPKGNDFLDIAAGGYFSAVIRNDGKSPGQGSLVIWGCDPKLKAPEGSDFVSVKGGNKHYIAMRAGGEVVGFGSNNYGQSASATGKGYIAVSGAGYRNVGLKANGSLALFPPRETMPAGTDYVAIGGGYGCYDFFLKKDGSLVQRPIGQVKPPQQLPGKDFVAAAAGYYCGLAMQSPPDKKPLKPTVHTFAFTPTAFQASAAPGEIIVHRAMDTGPALKVTYTVSGSAVADTDYKKLPGSVTIPEGLPFAIIAIEPIKNAGLDGKNVIVRLSKDSDYSVGIPEQATVVLSKGAAAEKKPDTLAFLARKIGPFGGPFAQEIKAIRALRRLTQAQLAEALKIDVATLQVWEAGWQTPENCVEILNKVNEMPGGEKGR